ncbi:MAG: hypothetical protein FWD48_10895 [Oscillospiraceae bacterium]|nr:hypothetical protein [Oscillospiraceae bacterium]
MYLHHYFNKANEPFRSISELPADEARKIFDGMASYLIEKEGGVYNPDQVTDKFIINRHKLRCDLECEMRQQFINKNGNAQRKYPYYLILSEYATPCKPLLEFYKNGDYIALPVEDFDMTTVSFTYGDSFVQYYHTEDSPYELVYTYDEILEIIKKHGWVAKNENGWGFVEAQLWSDLQINKYRGN